MNDIHHQIITPWTYTNNQGGEYIKVSDKRVATTKKLRENLTIDLDENGYVVGVEIIKN